jgi:hypothetical protein
MSKRAWRVGDRWRIISTDPNTVAFEGEVRSINIEHSHLLINIKTFTGRIVKFDPKYFNCVCLEEDMPRKFFTHPEMNHDIYLYTSEEIADVDEPYLSKELNLTESEVLLGAKIANPYWFRVMIVLASIMIERRYKYAGDKHPLYNFFDTAQRVNDSEGAQVSSAYITAAHYDAMKSSRSSVSGNVSFSDESMLDTILDKINYSILKLILKFCKFEPNEILK